MQGQIESKEQKESSSGPFHVLKINGTKYSVWEEIAKTIKVGDHVEYEEHKVEKNGKTYSNVKNLKLVPKPTEEVVQNTPEKKEYWARKDQLIIRQNALTQANNWYAGKSPSEENFFSFAERCEKWVMRE